MHTKVERGWESLYTIAAWSAILAAVIIPISIVIYFIWPAFPEDIFSVIQQSKLAGLMSLDFMYLVSNIFALPIFLALYFALKGVDRGWALIALVAGLLALVWLVPARPIFELLKLSDLRAAAGSLAERQLYSAAAEGLLAAFHGTAYYAHYVIGTLALLVDALLMLRSPLFSRRAAWIGILANLAAFGYFFGEIGVYISILSVLGLLVWWLLLARVFFRLAAPSQAAA